MLSLKIPGSKLSRTSPGDPNPARFPARLPQRPPPLLLGARCTGQRLESGGL